MKNCKNDIFPRVLTVKGKKTVHKLTSAKRGRLITVALCMSASESFIPPMVIFSRKNKDKNLEDDFPPALLIEYSSSRWITTQLFSKLFRHFVDYIHASKENPAVLICDGQYSHTQEQF